LKMKHRSKIIGRGIIEQWINSKSPHNYSYTHVLCTLDWFWSSLSQDSFLATTFLSCRVLVLSGLIGVGYPCQEYSCLVNFVKDFHSMEFSIYNIWRSWIISAVIPFQIMCHMAVFNVPCLRILASPLFSEWTWQSATTNDIRNQENLA
jgi:hypothetical protein